MIDEQFIDTCSLRSRLVSGVLRLTLKPKFTREPFDHLRFREWLERTNARRGKASQVDVSTVEQTSVCGEWHVPKSADQARCILYLHGGGYIFGSARAYRPFTTHLAKQADTALFSLDYRLAPEHPFPAAVDDAVAAYEWLLTQFKACDIVVMGDSAGGGLTLALLHALKTLGYAQPAGAVVLSPYADLLATGESLVSNGKRCAMFNAQSIQHAAALYLNGKDGAQALASPVYGRFTGFAPVSIHVSDSEALRDDAYRVAKNLDRDGASVQLTVWKNQPHVWPTFYPLLPEAGQCMREMIAFARACWRAAPGTGSEGLDWAQVRP